MPAPSRLLVFDEAAGDQSKSPKAGGYGERKLPENLSAGRPHRPASLLGNSTAPADEEKAPLAVFADPPLTAALKSLAVLMNPPLTAVSKPLAVLVNPPLIAAKAPLAVFSIPPLTEAKSPLIVLKRPTTIPPKREKLC